MGGYYPPRRPRVGFDYTRSLDDLYRIPPPSATPAPAAAPVPPEAPSYTSSIGRALDVVKNLPSPSGLTFGQHFDLVRGVLNLPSAGAGAIAGLGAAAFGSDAYGRSLEQNAGALDLKPGESPGILESMRVAPGAGQVLGEAIAPGRPTTAPGRIAKDVGSLVFDIGLDPSTYLTAGVSGAGKLGRFASGGERVIEDLAPHLGRIDLGLDAATDAVKAAQTISRGQAGVRAGAEILGSAPAGLVYGPDVAMATYESGRQAYDAFQDGRPGDAVEPIVSGLMTGALGGLMVRGAHSEAAALRAGQARQSRIAADLAREQRLDSNFAAARPEGFVLPEVPLELEEAGPFTPPLPDVWDEPAPTGFGAPTRPLQDLPVEPTEEASFLRPDAEAASMAEQARLARAFRQQQLVPSIEQALDQPPAAPRLTGEPTPPPGTDLVTLSPAARAAAAAEGFQAEPTPFRPAPPDVERQAAVQEALQAMRFGQEVERAAQAPPGDPRLVPPDVRMSRLARAAAEAPDAGQFDVQEVPAEMSAPLPPVASPDAPPIPRQASSLPPPTDSAVGNIPAETSIDVAAASTKLPTTDAQREAGNYRKGRARVAGLDVAVETPAGERRRPEWDPIEDHYGYFPGTRGKDKDQVDVFVRRGTPDDYEGPVFVVDQKKKDGSFDEHKVMLGYRDEAEARQAFARNYPPDSDRILSVGTFASPEEFKGWLDSGNKQKPTGRPGPPPDDAGAPVPRPRTPRPPDRPDARYAYRVRDVGEEGVPVFPDSHAQASMSEADVRRYAPSRRGAETPQEIVRVDLNRLAPDSFEVGERGDGAPAWVRFKESLTEDAVERVDDVGEADRVAADKADEPLRERVLSAADRLPTLARAAGLTPDQAAKGVEDVRVDGMREIRSPEAVEVKRAIVTREVDVEDMLDVARTELSKPGVLQKGGLIRDSQGVVVGRHGAVSRKSQFGLDSKEFPEAPSRIAKAIEKDADNPLYLRVKDAFRRQIDEIEDDKPRRSRIAEDVDRSEIAVDDGDDSFDPARFAERRAPVAPGQRGLFGSQDDVAPAREEPRKPSRLQRDLFGQGEMLQGVEARVTEGREREGALFTQERDARERQAGKAQGSMFDKPEPPAAPPAGADGVRIVPGKFELTRGKVRAEKDGEASNWHASEADARAELQSFIDAKKRAGENKVTYQAALDRARRGEATPSDVRLLAGGDDMTPRQAEGLLRELGIRGKEGEAVVRRMPKFMRRDVTLIQSEVVLQRAADHLKERPGQKAIEELQAKRRAQKTGQATLPTDETPSTKPATEPVLRVQEKEGSIQDAGEKIGGARKDRWAERGLREADLEGMTGGEEARYVVKSNIWKPDYSELLAGGMEPKAAALLKVVYDQIGAKPRTDTPAGRRAYLRMMEAVREAYQGAKTVADIKEAAEKAKSAVGVERGMGFRPGTPGYEAYTSIFKGRYGPLEVGYGELQRADKMVAQGFPGEPWQARFEVRKEYTNDAAGKSVINWQVVTKDRKRVGEPHETQEAARAAAREAYEDMKKDGSSQPLPERPHIEEVKREGRRDVRGGADKRGEDFLKDFGFRGIEYGNWAAQDERAGIGNHAYEALHDLADTLGIPPQALSLDGRMGLAFGARGGGRFAAHYEPDKLVINMTKKSGAGSLAHEWGHALDHYFGELDQPNAYQGAARGASGWYEPGMPPMGPRSRFKDGKYTVSHRLENLRPEMREAWDGVMKAIFKRDQTRAEAVRDAELALERAKGQVVRAKEMIAQGGSQKASVEDWLQKHGNAQVEARERGLASARGDEWKPKQIDTSYLEQARALSGKSGDRGYWTRPTELLARSFESYVFDKVKQAGGRSDYLVHGVEGDRFADAKRAKGNPYPAGLEREQINAAFDKLFQTMKVREGDKGPALYKERQPGAAAQAATDRHAAGEANAVPAGKWTVANPDEATRELSPRVAEAARELLPAIDAVVARVAKAAGENARLAGLTLDHRADALMRGQELRVNLMSAVDTAIRKHESRMDRYRDLGPQERSHLLTREIARHVLNPLLHEVAHVRADRLAKSDPRYRQLLDATGHGEGFIRATRDVWRKLVGERDGLRRELEAALDGQGGAVRNALQALRGEIQPHWEKLDAERSGGDAGVRGRDGGEPAQQSGRRPGAGQDGARSRAPGGDGAEGGVRGRAERGGAADDLAAGAGVRGRRAAGDGGGPDDVAREATRAFHGSAHDFDRFTTGRMGTGEGAQAYGWGMYFSGKKEVAEYYRRALSGPDYEHFDPKDIASRREELGEKWGAEAVSQAEYMLGERKGDLRAAINTLWNKADQEGNPAEEAIYRKAANLLQTEAGFGKSQIQRKGKLYEVDLKPDEGDYLNWDKPLGQQSEKVQRAFDDVLRNVEVKKNPWPEHGSTLYVDGRARLFSLPDGWDMKRDLTGQQLYGLAPGKTPEDASKALHAAGIPGIKYLDQFSRSGDGESHNYVIFDDADVETVAKFATRSPKPGPARPVPAPPANLEAAPAGLKRGGKTEGKPPKEPINLSRIAEPADVVRMESRVADSLKASGKTDSARQYRSWEEAREKAVAAGLTEQDFKRLLKEKGALTDVEIEAGRMLRETAFKDARSKAAELQRLREEGKDAGDAEHAYEASVARAAGILLQTVRAGGEAGRALAIHRKMSTAMTEAEAAKWRRKLADPNSSAKTRAEAKKRLDSAPVVSELERLAQRAAKERPGVSEEFIARLLQTDPRDARAIAALLRTEFRPSKRSWLYEAWINGLLSGLPTHLANVTGNAVTQLLRIPEKAMAGALDAAGAKLTGRPRERFVGEAYADLMGIKEGIKKGLRAFRDDWRDEFGIKDTGKLEHHIGAIPGKAGSVIRAPTRLLSAEDQFFKAVAATRESRALAYRKARQEGKSGRALANRIEDILTNLDDHADITEGMQKAADYETFTKKLGRFGQMMLAARDADPSGVASVIVPFMRTPLNIAKFTLERTPLNFIRLAAKGENAAEYAKPLMGTLIGLSFAMAAKEGLLTGGGPSDPKERQTLEATGWQPYSVKAGDQYISFKRIEPLSAIMGFAADLVETKDEDTQGDLVNKIVGSIAENLTDKTFLQGVEDLSLALSDPRRYMSQWAKSLEGSVVPAIVARTAQATDDTVRETSAVDGSAILARLPGLSRTVEPKRKGTGEPIERTASGLERFASPFQRSAEKGPEANLERAFLAADFTPSAPGRFLTIPKQLGGRGERLELTEAERKYLFNVRERVTNRLREIVDDARFKRRDPREHKDFFENAYRKAQSEAADRLWRQRDLRRRAADTIREARERV